MFAEHQIVKTKNFLYHKHSVNGVEYESMLPKQSRGTIIHIWAPGVYEVEFPTYAMTSEGEQDPDREGTPVIITVNEADLEECNEPL